MRRTLLPTLAMLAAALLAGPVHASAQVRSTAAIPVILDTDVWGDIDDVLALAGLHALQARGEAKILAVVSSTSDPWCATYIDLINTFYGSPDIPVGLVHEGVKPPARWAGDGAPIGDGTAMYTEHVSKLRSSSGAAIFPRRLIDGDKAPEAVALLRKTLAGQRDGTVVMIGVGFSTNFARLLESKPDRSSALNGRELVKRKVRLLSVMAGRFADRTYRNETLRMDRPEYNIRKDIPSAQVVFRDWPSPIVVSGSEVGFTMRFKGADIERRFNYTRHHPVVVTYRYMDTTYRTSNSPGGGLHDHKTFDLTSVLYAIRPDEDYFSLSPAGRISVRSDGVSAFEQSATGNVRYLVVSDAQRPRTLEAMTLLVSQPPRSSPDVARQ